MKTAARSILALLIAASPSLGFAVEGQHYWIMLTGENGSWCGYADENLFKRDFQKVDPRETVQIVIEGKAVKAVTYEVSPESGDWLLVDRYTSSRTGLRIRRSIMLTNDDTKIVESIEVLDRQVRVEKKIVTDLSGEKRKAIDGVLPTVAIAKDYTEFPFHKILEDILGKRVSTKLCR